MKKSSLMGASVVAAALLAAAPVAAPVASLATPGTQVVKAAGTVSQNGLDNAVSAVTNTLNGKKYVISDPTSDLDTTNAAAFAGIFKAEMAEFEKSDYLTGKAPIGSTTTEPLYIPDENNVTLKINKSLLPKYFFRTDSINLINADAGASLRTLNYGIKFHYSNAIGTFNTDVTTQAEVDSVISDMKNNGGTITLDLNLYDVNNHTVGSASASVSYNANNISAAYVKYDTTLNTTVGQSADQYNFVNSFANAGGSILDQKGNDVLKTAVDKGAVSVTNLREVNDNRKPSTDADGNFAKVGSYYQQIAINLDTAGVVVPKSDWALAAQNGLISVNGIAPSLNNIDSSAYLVTKTKGEKVNGQQYSKGTLVLKRVVNVGQAQGNFKTDKINGVVTVNMNDGMAAQVYDENGKMVLGRALPNKSAWKSFEKRTYYKDGQVFYQVSTNEYVKAQDVTFTENSSSSNSNSNDQLSGKVNVTKYPSKVINILNDSHAAGVYAINEDGQGMHQVIGRFLPAGSAWINQGTAEVNGNLFYQVSTNEWVSANSVAK